MNAIVYHATPTVTKRAIRDFGQKMVSIGKEDLLRHFSTADLDSVAELILEKASSKFLDKFLDARLRTIEAKPLINALARAERLGYEPGDIVEVEDEQDRQERVIPQSTDPVQTHAALPAGFPSAPVPSFPQNVQVPHSIAPGPTRSSSAQLQCPDCFRVFEAASAYHHVSLSPIVTTSDIELLLGRLPWPTGPCVDPSSPDSTCRWRFARDAREMERALHTAVPTVVKVSVPTPGSSM